MGIGSISNSVEIKDITRTNNKRILGEKFNYSLNDVNSGSKVNEPLMAFSNPKTGESIEIHRSDVYAEDNPLYILKGKTAEGKSFERTVHAWIIDPRNCDYSEMMVLNLETGNTSPLDKTRVDALFNNILDKAKNDEELDVSNYLDKADYSAAMKDVLDEYKKCGNWDSYLSMDKWQQSLKDYTSVPVYFNRDIIQRVTTQQNGVSTVSCSFATVKTAEDIQKEIDDKIKEAAKNNRTSIRDVLKHSHPNAENMKWGIVGSDAEMSFDEFVRYMEDENKKWVESNKAWLEEKGLWEYVH